MPTGRVACRAQLAVPETTLWFNLEVAAARYPDKAAYVYGGKRSRSPN